jgi:hypothetical protein
MRPILLAVAGTAALAIGATPAAAASCKGLPVKTTLSSADPTAFRGAPSALVKPSGRAGVSAVRVTLTRGGKTYATGGLKGTLPRGRNTVVRMRATRRVAKGSYKIRVSGSVAGCDGTESAGSTWKFGNPTMPVRAVPASTLVGDNVTAVRLFLRGVGNQRTARVAVALRDSAGATVTDGAATLEGGGATVDLPLASPLQPGQYVVRMTGSAPGVPNPAPADQEITFAPGGNGAPAAAQGNVAKATVDWYGGNWHGREAAGFVAPGIGHGEIVCRPDTQYIRFYPDELASEVAMMTWTYRDWGAGGEKALREALHAPGTGPDFVEGMNKFTPPENRSTGEFDGIISDRGPFGGPGGGPLAPPTTYKFTWEWDFSDPANARCHVEARFISEVDPGPPVVRSAQVVWRGDGNAAGRDTASVDVPGLGVLNVTCQPGEGGVHRLTLDAPQGGTVVTREGSDDFAVPDPPGKIETYLPNNGMLAITLGGGQTVTVASRYKLNDPDPAQNWCAIAAQAVSG